MFWGVKDPFPETENFSISELLALQNVKSANRQAATMPFCLNFFNQKLGCWMILFHSGWTSVQAQIDLKSSSKKIFSAILWSPGVLIKESIMIWRTKMNLMLMTWFLFVYWMNFVLIWAWINRRVRGTFVLIFEWNSVFADRTAWFLHSSNLSNSSSNISSSICFHSQPLKWPVRSISEAMTTWNSP